MIWWSTKDAFLCDYAPVNLRTWKIANYGTRAAQVPKAFAKITKEKKNQEINHIFLHFFLQKHVFSTTEPGITSEQ